MVLEMVLTCVGGHVTSNSTYKHLSLEDRKTIESLLNSPNIQLKQITKNLSRSEKQFIVNRKSYHNSCSK